MTDDEVLAEFRAADALLEGHFILSSGLRSPRYLQCARVLMDPARGSRLAEALAARIPAELRARISAVVSPAMGGVIAGHEMARALGVAAMFVERPSGTFELRRGFRLEPGQAVLMMEDVVTTGLSSREAIAAIEGAGGAVIAAAALVDRSNGTAAFDVPFIPLLRLEVPSYEVDALPPELAAIPAVKPGEPRGVSPFTGRAIGLGFAVLWLLLGAAALSVPWRYVVGVAGVAAIGALFLRARRMDEPRTGLFQMKRYWIAVIAEFAAIALAQVALNRLGLNGYLLPVVGVLVGLHFVGLWWAGGGESYLWLAGTMTVVNAVALLLPTGRAMQAAAGLGSAAALAWFAGTGRRT